MASVDNLALFIGVNDYSAFDVSTGKPKGTSDLLGSRNDAIIFWRVCRLLGFSPANMRILTSPRLSREEIKELEGASSENVGEATEREILASARWLAGEMSVRRLPAGFITFSGHGDYQDGKGMVLCPSDIEGMDLKHAIPFAKLQAIFAEKRAISSLTFLLDCCNSGDAAQRIARGASARGARGPGARARVLSLTGRRPPPSLMAATPLISDRVLAASEPGEPAFQSRFSSLLRGAFSWAVSSVMEQWVPRERDGGVFLPISHAELIRRSKLLLDALSFEQTPVFRGRPELAELPLFFKGTNARPEDTSSFPNLPPVVTQITPEIKVGFQLNTLEQTTAISVYGAITNSSTGAVTYNQNTEYWNLPSAFLSALSGASSLSSSGASLVPNSDGSVTGFPAATSSNVFGMASSATWLAASGTPTIPGSSVCFFSSSDNLGIQFDLNSGALVGVTWYRKIANGNSPGTYALGETSVTMSKVTSLTGTSGYSYYTMRLPMIKWSLDAGSTSRRIGGTSTSGASFAYNPGDSSWKAAVVVSGGDIGIYSSSSGTSWSGPDDTGGDSPVAPALAYWDGDLYVAYRAGTSGGDPIHVRVSTDDGETWSSATNTSGATSVSPAMAGFGSKLFLAYNGNGSNIWVRYSTNGSTWSEYTDTGLTSGGAPGMAAFNSKLYVAAVNSSGDMVVTWSSAGSSWSSPLTLSAMKQASQALNSGATLGPPTLAAYGSSLLIVCRDSANQVWLASLAEEGPLLSVNNLSVQSPAVTTSDPTIASNAGALMLGYIASDRYLYALGTI